MDSSRLDDHNLMKNSNPMLTTFRQFIRKIFRVTEIFLVLALLKWASTYLPVAVRISGEFFRQLVNVVVSHLFVFILSNAIVLTLIFNSRHFFPHFQNLSEAEMEELIENTVCFSGENDLPPPSEEIMVDYEEKQTDIEVMMSSDEVKVHRRSQSENLRREKMVSLEKGDRRMRRSESEMRRRVGDGGGGGGMVVDELSNEEFQSAIEAFIAKQIKFHNEN